MKPKTALVTGVSRPLGLGFAVARQLAEKDYHVILRVGQHRDGAGLPRARRFRSCLNRIASWLNRTPLGSWANRPPHPYRPELGTTPAR